MDWNLMDMEEDHQQAFGEHTGIDEEVRDTILSIKDNSDELSELGLSSEEIENFTNLAWELLGRYIANNTHLKTIGLGDCGISDEKMAFLCSELVRSESLHNLGLDNNEFGIEGLRSLVPFLRNCPNLSTLFLTSSSSFNNECFDLLISILSGTTIANLFVGNCNISDFSALETYNISNLKELILNNNNIGREGCITISNLLQQEGSTLIELYMVHTGIDDEGAEIIANSLKHNTTLKKLNLCNGGITEKVCKVFLKLLVGISSIENTYTSNHTLIECTLIRFDNNEIQSLIKDACKMNRMINNPGRAKVIKYQLNSKNRKKLCHLQGIDIEYSTSNIFADIEPVLLPEILALIGDRHDQSELYTALVPAAPDLLSYIDRKAMLNDILAKNKARASSLSKECKHNLAECQAEYERKMASLKTEYSYQTSLLTAHNVEVSNRLEMIDLGDKKQSAGGTGVGKEESSSSSSSKKQRI